MAKTKKKQSVRFAKDKNAFAGGASTRGKSAAKKAKRKQSGAHQPRDADVISGHDINQSAKQNGMKPEQSKTFRHDVQKSGRSGQSKTFGHDVQKPERSGQPKTFGHDVQKSGRSGQPKTFGHDVRKSEWSGQPKTFGHDVRKSERSGQSKTFGHDASKLERLKQSKILGHDVQKLEQSGQSKTFGHNVQKPERSGQPQFFGHNINHFIRRNDLGLRDKPNRDSFQDNQNSVQSDTRKTTGQKAKPSQKKRRQQKKSPKENSFTENKEVPDSDSAGSKMQNSFSKEQNPFTQEEGGEQPGETKDSKGDYHRGDTYHQSQKKGRYRRREHQDGERTKTSDIQRYYGVRNTAFTEKNTFPEGGEPVFRGSEKLNRLQKKAENAGKKIEAARKKLPKKKEYSLERVFDEKTGRANYVLTAVVREKPFKENNPVKKMAGRAGSEFTNYAHGKVAESEKENSAVEGAHKMEQKAEDVYRFAKQYYKSKEQRRRGKVAKLENKQIKKEVNFRYQKFLEENPEMQEKTLKKQLQKRMQKQRIKQEYAKARRAEQAAKDIKEEVVKSANFTTKVARKLQEMAAKHISLLVTAGAFVLLLIMLMTSISSCGAMSSDGMSTTLVGSYMSTPAEIDAVELAFSGFEMELQKEIGSTETDYPDYDEYRYNLGAVGHDPFALISYLSTVHTEFTAAGVQDEIEHLFDEMYELTLSPSEETRTRMVTKTGLRTITDPETGEETEEEYEYEEEEEYTVTILEVTLTAKDLNVVVAGYMDSAQKEIYALYNETHGLIQQFYTPLNLYWYNYISSYYGYRINPVTGAEQLHRGVDIAVPAGTAVLAAMDGTVTTAAYDSYYGNYVVIEDGSGYCTKYAHMDMLCVSTGQAVKHGDAIGTIGSTGDSAGSHLHIECMYNGEYCNPLFYFEAGEGTLYGEIGTGL